MALRGRLRRWRARAFWPAVAAWALVCGCHSATAPTQPSESAVAGTWTGSGTDSQGAFAMTWTLTQIGSMVSGTVATRAVDPADGSCASCHKNKSGTLTGTMSSGALTFTMSFPSGGSDGTPLCGVDMSGTTTRLIGSLAGATYSGADSCEGPFSGGAFSMTRQP